MKVLFVAFELPPLGTGGVHRSVKFLKYLPQHGITPVALTTDVASYQERGFLPLDHSLNGIPPSVVIERIPCPLPVNGNSGKFSVWRESFFSLVERHSREWEPHLAARLPAILKEHKPEAIYVTLPPFGLAPIWSRFAKQYKLPIVFDFRDHWSLWGSAPNTSWFHYQLKLRAEDECLRTAARVVCATEGVRRDLLAVHPNIPAEKLVTITNGFDAEVTEWPTALQRDPKRQDFVIGYLGNFYYAPSARAANELAWWRKPPHRMLHYSPRKEDWLYRTPYFLFRAVRVLLERRPELREHLRIRFACQKPDWLDSQINEFGLGDIVECLGYVQNTEVPDFLAQCDCALATSVKVIDGADYCIAGKTFDYFLAGKPILGFVTAGTQKDVLLNSGMGIICDPDDPQASALVLEDWIEGRIKLKPEPSFLRSFHRRELAGQLADVFFGLKSKQAVAQKVEPV